MVSLNDVLLAMSNIPVDDPIAEIWGRQMQGGYKIIEYTGTLPITINANGDALLDYRIYGADGGVGEQTENLWNNYFANGTYEPSGFRPNSFHICGVEKIPIKADTQYSISYVSTYPYPINRQYLYEFDAQGERLRQRLFDSKSFTTSSDAASCTISVGSTTAGIKPDDISDFMLVEGSTTPTTYIPYGYKLPMTVTNNLAPPLSQWVDGYINTSGGISSQSSREEKSSDFIKVKPSNNYVFGIEGNAFPQGTNGGWVAIGLYRDDRTFIQRRSANTESPYTFSTSSDTKYVRLSYRTYGELLEPGLSEFSFSIPVYIGDNQLDAGEYVSYSDGKIYRMVDGTLTPTDPPVPLPEIPTIGGTTVIDYDGDPKPSQMYVKYKGKG